MTNSADPDQPTDLDIHCLLRQGMSCSAREGLKCVFSKRKQFAPHGNKILPFRADPFFRKGFVRYKEN